MKLAITAALVLGTLALDPWFGCARPSYDYSEADMKRAIEGRWRLAFDKRAIELTITEAHPVERHASRGLVQSAAACGSRSFVNTASACYDSSTMEVEVATPTGKNRGRFTVAGLQFDRGFFDVEIDKLYISAQLRPDGEIVAATVLDNGTQIDHVTMDRQ